MLDRVSDTTRFAVRTYSEPGGLAVEAFGELDLVTAAGLEAEIHRAESSDADAIVLDLDALRRIDLTGLRVVLSAAVRDESRGRLTIRGGDEGIHGLLEILGLGTRSRHAAPA